MAGVMYVALDSASTPGCSAGLATCTQGSMTIATAKHHHGGVVTLLCRRGRRSHLVARGFERLTRPARRKRFRIARDGNSQTLHHLPSSPLSPPSVVDDVNPSPIGFINPTRANTSRKAGHPPGISTLRTSARASLRRPHRNHTSPASSRELGLIRFRSTLTCVSLKSTVPVTVTHP
jgi:hypothetical protein